MQSTQNLRLLCSSFLLCLISLVMAGCGGSGAAAGTGVATSITVTPSALSLNAGQVEQITAVLLDANSNTIANTTYTYTATGAIQVSTNGLVCAGTWDSLTTPIICTPPATPSGTGVVTVSSGGITQTIQATIHPRIARVTVTSTASGICNSQGETQQYSAQAFDANNVLIPAAQAGTFVFASSNNASVTIDANGLATAVQPGGAFITATNDTVVSVPAAFNSCQPLSIVLSPSTPVSIAVGGTATLTATVTDIKGNPITGTGLVLSFISSNSPVASVTTGGLITGVAAGSTGVIASCSPPSCNGGANANIPVYSNLVPVTVSGTSSTTVYATGANAISIVPIATAGTAANTAGTAITIPQVSSIQPTINSFVFAPDGQHAYLGSDRSMLILTTSATTPTIAVTTAQFSGKVLAVSPNGNEVIYADTVSATPKTYVYNTVSATFTQLALTTFPTTAAAFSPDSLKAYLINGGQLWIYSAALAPPLIRQSTSTFSAPFNDATFLSQGSLGYLAGGAPNAVTVLSTCDKSNGIVSTITGLPATPLKIASSFDSTHVFAVDGAKMDDITVSGIGTVPGQNCPATVTNSAPVTTSFVPAVIPAAFTPEQLIVTSDGSNVFVTTASNSLLRYVTASHAVSTIALTGGGTITTGGATLDGKSLYLGATSTNDVHRIDVTAGSDTPPIAVNLKNAGGTVVSPDFVVVQPK